MHITAETFHTINFRQWEASQVCNEMSALLEDGGGLDLEAYPALDTLFGAIQHIGKTQTGVPISQENNPGEAGASELEDEETA